MLYQHAWFHLILFKWMACCLAGLMLAANCSSGTSWPEPQPIPAGPNTPGETPAAGNACALTGLSQGKWIETFVTVVALLSDY